MAKSVSIYLDDDLKEKAIQAIKQRGMRSFSEYASKLIKDNLEGTTSFSPLNKNPITDLFKAFRPSLAQETSEHLKKIPISEIQLLDNLLTALHIWLEGWDHEDGTDLIVRDATFDSKRMLLAMKKGEELKNDSAFKPFFDPELSFDQVFDLIAESKAPYKTTKKPKNERPKP